MWIPLENICVGVSFYKATGLKAAILLKRDFNTTVFLWNLQNFLDHLFLKSSSGCFWGFNSCFQRSSEKKPVQLSAINTRRKKKYLMPPKSRSSHRRCSVKEGLQMPAQVFSSECCEFFKNTYFEKHLWTAASKNQHFSGKFTEEIIPEFYYPIQLF